MPMPRKKSCANAPISRIASLIPPIPLSLSDITSDQNSSSPGDMKSKIDDLISKAAAYHACEAWQRMYETRHEAKLKNEEIRARFEELKGSK